MAKVIEYLSSNYREQPNLETLANIAGLSVHHFQRTFTDWVGVTPKSFLQHITHNNAKNMLLEGQSILDVSNEVGLSSPSRLHDLCVSIDAASPGEIKEGGAGLSIHYGFDYCPFGECLVASSERGIMQLTFIESQSRSSVITDLQKKWPQASLQEDGQVATKLIQRLFTHNEKQTESLRAYVSGTKFQLKVWTALLSIPLGHLSSYGELAKTIGQASAARAVGSAIGKNPLAYLIPCHRVIRETGVFGGYRWGNGRKRLMIAYESIRRPLV